jgi:hypothetical protein
MRKLELTTDLIGVGGFCTYHGAGNTEYTLHEDRIQEDFDNGDTDVHPDYYWMHFDNKKYTTDWNKKVQDYLEANLVSDFKRVLGMDIVYTDCGYSSPREYNFRGDWNLFDIECTSFVPLLRFCLSRQESFGKFLKENYTSYDGFLSFTSNNIKEWKLDIKADCMTAWGAAVRFFLQEESDMQEHDPFYVFHDMFYTEYVDYTALDQFIAELKDGSIDPTDFTEDWQKALFERDVCDSKGVTDDIHSMYLSGKSNEEIADILREKYGEYPFEKIISRVFGEIESNNLTLEL